MHDVEKRSKRRRWRKNDSELFVLSLPGVIYILIMSYLPMVGVIVAFKYFNYRGGIFGSPWVGFQNFQFFFESLTFWTLIRNTVLYNIGFIIAGTAVGVSLAVLLYLIRRSTKLVTTYQAIIFLPYFLSVIVVGDIVYALLSYNNGLITHLFSSLGLGHPDFYQMPSVWPYILLFVNLWMGVGFSALLYFTGLIGIDPTYFEVADVEGATRWDKVRHIMLPLLAPVVSILLILSIGGLFSANFGLFYFVPQNSSYLYPATDVINTYVFRALIDLNEIGMPAAIGLLQSAIGLVLVVVANWIVRRINADNSLF